MKKLVLIALTVLMPMSAMAYRNTFNSQPEFDIPSRFSISGETKTLEWGCPIDNEPVEGDNQKSVLNQLISECLDQVTRSAEEKPEVAAVIEASVIAPNVAIREEAKGVHRVNGTIFLQTVVSLNRTTK